MRTCCYLVFGKELFSDCSERRPGTAGAAGMQSNVPCDDSGRDSATSTAAAIYPWAPRGSAGQSSRCLNIARSNFPVLQSPSSACRMFPF